MKIEAAAVELRQLVEDAQRFAPPAQVLQSVDDVSARLFWRLVGLIGAFFACLLVYRFLSRRWVSS